MVARETPSNASVGTLAPTWIAPSSTCAARAETLGRAYATKTTKPTTKSASGRAAAKAAAKGDGKTKTKAGAAPAKAKTSRAKKPPIGKIRAVPHVEAKKFPLHESVLGDSKTYRVTVGDAAAKARTRATAPPPPTSGNRVMPHAKAATFPLHESILAEAQSMATKGTVLMEPLSRPAGAAAPPAAASAAPAEEKGSNRAAILAAAAVGIVGILAYSTSGVDEEDRPPPPRRAKPKAPAARKDVEVQIEIVKPPDAKELKNLKKVNPETKNDGKETAKEELSDAFSATAEFLANAKVPQDEPEQEDPEVLAKYTVPEPPPRENVSVMDPSKSLSAARLVEEAVKTLGDTLSDAEKAALKDGMKVQSESDMKVFKELSSSMVRNFETVVGAERLVTDELIAAINVLEQRAEDTSRQLEQEKERAVVDKERALKTQEKKLKAEHADFLVAERIERIRALDEERIRMGALRQVLKKRREALERAHAVQCFELAVMDFGSRIEKGETFQDSLVLLNACAQNDPFIAIIIQGLDQDVAKRGIPTRLQLAEHLGRVRDTARKLSLVPQDGGGMLAHGLAYAASLLRVKDTSDEGAQGIEGAIAKAETYLANGELMNAAKSLSSAAEGTKAATSVAEWAQHVRLRAEVEQAQTALNAHAQCRASALV